VPLSHDPKHEILLATVFVRILLTPLFGFLCERQQFKE
jgi:hypothetical protein